MHHLCALFRKMSIRLPKIKLSEEIGPMNEFESIADKAPAIADEAYGWDPKEVSASENKIKRQFKCHLGHIWEGRIYDRVRLGSGCQVCSNRIVLKGFNDLGTTHPDLAQQADGWDPAQIHKGVGKKLPWKCSLGHSWSATVTARTSQGQGCPFCSNKRILAGFNDLATKFPEVASQAHNWDPTGVTASDKRVAEWICPFGHISNTSILSKTLYPSCRICSGRELQSGVTDLASTNPDIASEAYGWDPAQFLPSSSDFKNWKCPEGHIYEKRINRRLISGCPFCGGKQVFEGFNDLKSRKPDIAAEAFGWDPATVSWGSKKVMIWKCPEGHEYDMAVSLRTGKRPQKCPICSGMRIQPGFNDLATRYPQFAKEAFGWDPSLVSPGTHRVLNWKCQEGHVFAVSPNQRTSRTSNCPTCANLIIETGFNDLSTTHPELAIQAFGWDPKTIGAGSSKRLNWRCQEGHVWDSSPVNRTWNHTGCPICVNQLVLIGYNDLTTTHPELCEEVDGWDPQKHVAGSKKVMPWICSKGHKYSAQIQNRALNNTGCPVCINAKVLVGYNDLATTHPEIAKQALGWDPRTVVGGSNVKRPWKCSLGHDWVTNVAARTTQLQNCPYCANLKAWPGFNDLLTRFPLIAREAVGWDPSHVMPGSAKKLRWKCPEGHSYVTTPSSRTGPRSSGCAKCANSGFNQNDKGYLYFLSHDLWEMYQIGITNVPEKRLAKHAKLGWEVVEVRGPMDGLATLNWETAILRMLKAKGAHLGLTSVAGKFDGYTECWTKSSFETSGLRHLMELTDELDLNNM